MINPLDGALYTRKTFMNKIPLFVVCRAVHYISSKLYRLNQQEIIFHYAIIFRVVIISHEEGKPNHASREPFYQRKEEIYSIMYAVIETGGKQYRAEVGDKFRVERLGGETSTEIIFDKILAVGGEGTKVGTAIVNAVVNVNKDTFNTAKQNIFNYLDGIRIAHDSLSEEENALVNIISQSAEGYVSSSVSNEEKSV